MKEFSDLTINEEDIKSIYNWIDLIPLSW